ncbi:hypothetical protein OH214_03415 [Idiomarina abyssalis]|uniref:hypothetical protein n=1 Tax=Idiomarina abyssalis TaxID=86102 RepID=UPI00230119D5|nr:hypothetical protein [Idiomarina abyssalis]MDA6066174.1 hypothetical protein [Idiomarina abyssalis]
MTQANVNEWQTALLKQVDQLIELAKTRLPARQQPTIRGPEYWQRFAKHHYVRAADLLKAGNGFEAAKHFRRAALFGHSKAMLYLGQMFLQGKDLPESVFHACCWLTLADRAGEVGAEQIINDLLHKLTARELNSARQLAAERFEQICEASFDVHSL